MSRTPDDHEQVLAPGWRCSACEYPLEGLPDRAEHTRCPECGHVARPARSSRAVQKADIAMAVMVSLWCALIAGLMGLAARSSAQGKPPAEGMAGSLVLLGIAAGVAYVGVVAWGVPFGRWRVGRRVGAIVAAGLGAISGWRLVWNGDTFAFPLLVFSIMAMCFLLQPEINRWLRRPPQMEAPQ